MYMVYSFFLIFIIMMLSTLMINNYKKSFLEALKNDVKVSLKDKHIVKTEEENPTLPEKNAE